MEYDEEQSSDALTGRPSAPERTDRRRRLALAGGSGALAVLAAVALSACGGSSSDSSSSTSASSGSTSAQSAPADTTASTTADSTATTDDSTTTTPDDTTTTSDSGSSSSDAADNGVSGKSADEILAAARSAALGAGAVHVNGDVNNIGLDLSLVRGKGAVGSISEGPTRFDIVYLGRAVYLKGSDSFYRQLGGDAAVKLLAGRWLKVPASGQDFRQFAELGDMQTLMSEALSPDNSRVTKGEASTVNGAKAIGLDSNRGTLFVATTGDAFPLQISQGGRGAGKVVFDRWNQAADLTPPADAIDISQLQRMSSSTAG